VPPDSSKRFLTIALGAGAVVLLAAIAIGQHMGDRVLGAATQRSLPLASELATPEPYATSGPFGPDWRESETLSAAADPRFPDPRVPPQPLPTRLPATPAPLVPATPTPNPNIPIWRQQPLPTATPIPSPLPTATDLETPAPTASPQ